MFWGKKAIMMIYHTSLRKNSQCKMNVDCKINKPPHVAAKYQTQNER